MLRNRAYILPSSHRSGTDSPGAGETQKRKQEFPKLFRSSYRIFTESARDLRFLRPSLFGNACKIRQTSLTLAARIQTGVVTPAMHRYSTDLRQEREALIRRKIELQKKLV